MALPEWGTSSGGVQGSQLLPARQSSSQRRLGVGSVLGPCQVGASPALLHQHRGLSLFWAAGTRARAPGSHGVQGTGRWGVDACLGAWSGDPGGNESPFTSHVADSDIISLLLIHFFLSLAWQRTVSYNNLCPQPTSWCSRRLKSPGLGVRQARAHVQTPRWSLCSPERAP